MPQLFYKMGFDGTNNGTIFSPISLITRLTFYNSFGIYEKADFFANTNHLPDFKSSLNSQTSLFIGMIPTGRPGFVSLLPLLFHSFPHRVNSTRRFSRQDVEMGFCKSKSSRVSVHSSMIWTDGLKVWIVNTSTRNFN